MYKLAILFITLFTVNILAQESIVSTINSVTVFKQNAEITRNVQINLKKGTQEIVLSNISTSINSASLQVQVDNLDITLLSAKYELNYLKSFNDSPKIKNLKNKLDELNDESAWIGSQIEILNGTEDILNKNKELSSDNGFTPNQVIELTNVYKTKLLEIRKEKNILQKQAIEIQKEKSKIKKQFNEKNAKFNTPSGNIVLKIDAKNDVISNLKCTYIVNNAGWKPLYDLRSASIAKNVQLNYKANIYQNTGLDWSNVNMIVSTGNPMQNNDRPILNPLYSQIYTNNYNDKLEEVVVTAYGKKEKKALGYSNMMTNGLAGSTSGIKISRNSSLNIDKDGFNYNANVTNNQINIQFKIANTQSIKSDGKQNLIALKNYDLETKYVYHAVPKLAKNAFLLAKIKDWGKYNLENGEANIFFEGAYIGKTFINSQVTTDTLLISMGRDNAIQVTRKPMTAYKSAKFIGVNKKQTFGYDILIKNKKTMPIKIEVLDQIPVSQNKLINVDLIEKSKAKYTEQIGKILWKLNINSQETIKKQLVYLVKYPKKFDVINLK